MNMLQELLALLSTMLQNANAYGDGNSVGILTQMQQMAGLLNAAAVASTAPAAPTVQPVVIADAAAQVDPGAPPPPVGQ